MKEIVLALFAALLLGSAINMLVTGDPGTDDDVTCNSYYVGGEYEQVCMRDGVYVVP